DRTRLKARMQDQWKFGPIRELRSCVWSALFVNPIFSSRGVTMSEQETRPNAPVSDSTSQGIGARLAQEREAKGWSQDYVSERLKFSLRQLRALEDEEWEKLPQGVPLRGFVRNYARLLGIDITAQLHALPGNTDPVSLNQASTLTTPLANARKSTREWPASSRTRRRPATWLVGVLMLL